MGRRLSSCARRRCGEPGGANATLTTLAALLTLLATLSACRGRGPVPDRDPPAQVAEVSLFFTTELAGTLEPCGCTSDPLGDLARTAALVATARAARPTVLFDGGSTLYPEASLAADRRPQAELSADLLANVLPTLGLAAAALGPLDLATGPGGVRLPRHAVNLPASAGIPLVAPRVLTLGGARIGVFGVVDPALVPLLAATDPMAAARTAVLALRADGADLIVALAHLPRATARRLAREVAGIDLVLVGAGAAEPADRDHVAVETAGNSFLLQPLARGQSVVRVDLALRAGATSGLTDAIGAARAATLRADLDAKLVTRSAELAAWERQPDADREFVAARRAEVDELTRTRDELVRRPLRVPERGSWFVAEELRVTRDLPCDAAVVEQKRVRDRAVGEANRRAFATETPAAVPPGAAGYAGLAECGYCHAAAVEFWKTTRHAVAWETLEVREKQWDRECIGCHVTGWLEPGGATMGASDALRDVQCETCHGPAALHVEFDGKERPSSLVRATPESRCATCHSPEHSDTFDYRAYLRDVTGPGHGEAYRRELGDGPTGKALRAAALARAARTIGAACPR